MLKLDFTRIDRTVNGRVASGASLVDEGQALAVVDEGGQLAVKPTLGTSADVFYGVSMFERRAPATLPGFLTLIGTGAQFTHQIANFVNGSELILIDGAALNATPEVTITSGGLVTVEATAAEGAVVTIAYTYEPTLNEVRALVGTTIDMSTIDAGADVGVGKEGVYFTSNIDTTAAWAVGAAVKTGAGGKFTVGGSGVDTGGICVSVPRDGEPFAGIEF